MKLEVQLLLNEFIDRNFTVGEMSRVLEDISDYQDALKDSENPKRVDMRSHDFEWLATCEEYLETTLNQLGLDYEPKDLIEL